ncbi:MAG: hypothetical protein KKE08_18905 [Gammaproteobacteria bacterium]|nr:hypothetical protein [Gammaproteobacteria bacterium]MBU2185099.1 hypothetical protein [Gammaproteobacteria bacterium]MBU2206967.1 hypothetical protein [Gammaproteobacteria bacterium]
MKTTLTLCLLLCLTACSNKAVYQDLQRNKRNECLQAPPAEYDRCMRSMDMSYEEYERQRQQALKGETHNSKEQ